ncbi:DNA-binding PadR family transcriptional regulator [Nocardioides luteus]|uniref:PadR family transcriptional regulator n=1 Tax=Nocardioides luteus TaxID=1844 RepID=A0ABQ5SQA7_9ACTN|nr:PadR family transcriptional regulator [Nocardioides luteus]MDR7313272.1 DNA-binding PadR family transcriptional regulator [Nocardioides luteus]GGR42886.1 PadR family transcriptional regulator [Nocardioides luteus]GLJ66337.1 PadR family transcriptional regulator [Nocardioides luteus]
MAGDDTRMLLLGAVALFEPVNGYQIRRELMSWQVDQWANINPGSIYHALTSLSDKGHLTRHDLVDNGRTVAVYEISDSGRSELERLVSRSLQAVDVYNGVSFYAAFSLMPLLERPAAIQHLSLRLKNLERTLKELDAALRVNVGAVPPHVTSATRLQHDKLHTERTWLVEVLDDVRSGRLSFVDEAPGWTPADDDPGWQMDADRRRYREMLRR